MLLYKCSVFCSCRSKCCYISVAYSVFQVGVCRSVEGTRGISSADVGSDDEDVDDMLVETVL